MVLTAKHVDGFLLWNSRWTVTTSVRRRFTAMFVREIAKAAHAQTKKSAGIFRRWIGRDPDCRSAHNDRFVLMMQKELRELLSNYGKVDLLWFDMDFRPAAWNPPVTYKTGA